MHKLQKCIYVHICACTSRQGRQSECNSHRQKRGRWLISEKCGLMQEEAILTMMFSFKQNEGDPDS